MLIKVNKEMHLMLSWKMQTNPSLVSTDGVFVGVYKAALSEPAGAASPSPPVGINRCNPVIPATSCKHFLMQKGKNNKQIEIIINSRHPKCSSSGWAPCFNPTFRMRCTLLFKGGIFPNPSRRYLWRYFDHLSDHVLDVFIILRSGWCMRRLLPLSSDFIALCME